MSTANPYDLVLSLTSEQLSERERYRLLRDFAHELGWRPSYYLVERMYTEPLANAHLIVEHGLEPSAVVTFLDARKRETDLSLEEQRQLLSLSYNNLVDWHVYIEPRETHYLFNRTEPPHRKTSPISRSDYEGLRNEAFGRITSDTPSPTLRGLDDALISTISDWKRSLSAELEYRVATEHLSALFNALLFARTVEDYKRRRENADIEAARVDWEETRQKGGTLRESLRKTLERLVGSKISDDLFDEQQLASFDALDPATVSNLLYDFYHNRFAPYPYDFSVISQHALSRIYERYTALLHVEETPQLSFFPSLPEEDWNKRYGSIYTPQFIARFFARFLRDHMTPKLFRQMKVLDPACGSGIFLRTLLEIQCDSFYDNMGSNAIVDAFQNVHGWDRDRNATYATRFSLASLHLTLTGALPRALNILAIESISYFLEHPELAGTFDAVVMNPPFVALEMQSPEIRDRIAALVGKHGRGRLDTYLAFLRLAMELLAPGGYGLLVLPHSFLLARNAEGIRRLLFKEHWIHCLADLSAIRVFGNLGAYVILLVFQKQPFPFAPKPAATIIKCQDLVGHALEDYLEGKTTKTPYYTIYEADQDEFIEDRWILLPPTESRIRRRLRMMGRLEDMMEVREGMITGADSVFILDEANLPGSDHRIFVPFLPDRQMGRYSVPAGTGKVVFYPFVDGRKLTGPDLAKDFPDAWRYLESHRSRLEQRKPVVAGRLEWWEPVRPRAPEELLRPKIVSPHLVIMPRFSLDQEGKYAISRAPYLFPRTSSAEDDLLAYVLAVLNSPVCYWYITTHSHKMSQGYTMLEPKTLKDVPIPAPARVESPQMDRLLSLVKSRVEHPESESGEAEIEAMIAQLYGLSTEERKTLGIEY